MSFIGSLFNSKKNKQDAEEDVVVVSSPVSITPDKMMPKRNNEPLDICTLAIHSDRNLDKAGDVAPPIHVSTTFDLQKSTSEVYSRVRM
jgi:hypothetical protein